jgi:hypothetical protein
MAYDEGLASRIREAIGEQPGLAEKKMFGGLAFLVDGNMACGVRGDDLIVRVAAEEADAALDEPGARPFDLTGRPMKGWLMVAADGHARTTTCAAGSTGAWPTPARYRPSSRGSKRPGWGTGSGRPSAVGCACRDDERSPHGNGRAADAGMATSQPGRPARSYSPMTRRWLDYLVQGPC